MSTDAKNYQTHCKIAQLHEAVYRIRYDREDDGSFERLVCQLDDVNIKGISDKPKYGRLCASEYKGCTPLHVACYQNHIKLFDSLLKRGADFTAKNADGNSALHHAFYHIFAKNLGTTHRIIGRLKEPLINSVLMAHVETLNYENPCSEEGLSHFHIACAANHVEAVQLFLDNGVCVDKSVNADSSLFPGYTPLHFAARFCGYETAKLLLERGADLTLKNAKGMHPLHMIIRRKWRIFESKSGPIFSIDVMKKLFAINEKIMKMFLESSPAVDVGIKELAKLLCAYTTSDSSLTESLLRDVDVKCAVSMDCSVRPGFTALHLAAHLDAGVEILSSKLLLENGANILAKDAKGVTPFDIYMQKYNLENLSDILSSVPAFKDVFFSDNHTGLLDFISAMQSKSTFNEFFRTSRKDIFLPENCHPWPGYWLPHLAVAFCIQRGTSMDGHYMIEACLSFEDIAVVRDSLGRTPIHLAYYQRKFMIIDMFLKHQSKITDIIDNYGLSHLHMACLIGNRRAVKMLLPTVDDINGIYKGETLGPSLASGWRPLHFAVAGGNVEVIKMLLAHGADAHATDANGRTPIHRVLHVATCYSNVSKEKEIGDLLFSACDLKNIVVSGTGLSYLHVASSIGNEDAVKDLLKLGANPNAEYSFEKFRDHEGISRYDPPRFLKRTPLHCAVINKHAKVVELLLQGGADILHKKSDGMTLFYEAFKKGKDPLPSEFGGIPIGTYFASMIANDVILQERVKEDAGITSLHIACVLHDVDKIKSLLIDSAANPNSQIHSNSPIWPKATPLHLLISFGRNADTLKNAMKLLLDYGADVTLMDENEDSPTHTFISYVYEPKLDYTKYLHLLLTSQKDFSLNPINGLGISHFHVACMAQEYAIVEKFVENGADVNFPIYFRNGRLTFQTPLHIVLKSQFLNHQRNNETLLRTIDVLLKYGADVNAQDECCSTPLLEAARMGPSRELVFENLIKVGADSNYTNMRGESVFETLFKSRDPVTCEEFSFCISNRVHFDMLNPISHKGIISIKCPTNCQNFIKAVSEAPNLLIVDRMGRTPIHSLVANSHKTRSRISVDKYADEIEQILKLGYDIDAQDVEGKTALHMAAYWYSEVALSALLDTGADVNVTDVNKEPAITRNVRARYRGEIRNGTNQQHPSPTERTFALHIITLQLCGLEVCSENLELANNLSRDEQFLSHCEQVSKEIEMAKQMTIGTGSLTLNGFFSETGIVAARPSMASEVDREAVDKLLENIDVKRFRLTRGLIKMQYKKTMTRLSLIQVATESARQLIGIINGFSMPEICLRMILRFLTNTEVKKLIKSTSAKVANEQ